MKSTTFGTFYAFTLENVLAERKSHNWFTKVRSHNFDIEDVPCSGQPVETDENKIKGLTDADRWTTIRNIIFIPNKKIVFHFDQKKKKYTTFRTA